MMRLQYLDNIRSITIILVVVYHAIFIFNNVIPQLSVGAFSKVQYQDVILYILHPWIMIILFIISGMCSRYYLSEHTIKEFVIVRTQKLLVPSTVGLFAFGWVQGSFNLKIFDSYKTIQDLPYYIQYLIMCLSGTGVLWFIQALWGFSMILALITKFEKRKLYQLTSQFGIIEMILFVIPAYISGLVLNTPIITVYRFGIYGFTFFLGYFVFAHDEVIVRIAKYRYLLILTSIISGIVYVKLHFGENYGEMPCVGCISAVAYAWSSILAIFGTMKIIGNKQTKVMRILKSKSFGIYVFHYLPLSVTAYYTKELGKMPPFICYLLVFISATGMSIILFEVFSANINLEMVFTWHLQ